MVWKEWGSMSTLTTTKTCHLIERSVTQRESVFKSGVKKKFQNRPITSFLSSTLPFLPFSSLPVPVILPQESGGLPSTNIHWKAHQTWSSKHNYVPSLKTVSTQVTVACAADAMAKLSGWEQRKQSLCTIKERNHKSLHGHKRGEDFTKRTLIIAKRKK